MRPVIRAVLSAWMGVLSAVALAACGPLPPPVEPNETSDCDMTALAKLQSRFAAQLLLRCSAFESLDDCPEPVQSQVEEEFSHEFDAWINCPRPE